jgi:hypothetical protein
MKRMKRKLFLPLTTVVLVAAAAFAHPVSAVEEHHHHGENSAAGQELQLNAGQQWATDAALRQ